MTTGLIDIMKRAAIDAVENNKPCEIRYGTVISTSPIKIQITSDLILPSSVLIIPEHLTDYETKISFDNPAVLQVLTTWDMSENPETESEPAKLSFKKKQPHNITIYNALKVGDKVALLRQSGGQTYFVLDRLQKG